MSEGALARWWGVGDFHFVCIVTVETKSHTSPNSEVAVIALEASNVCAAGFHCENVREQRVLA